ncbi:MAG: preprotein translocase subunit YajC [Bacteroidales bacterium]|nr:preprotein translocase subunit YajC [Bacteroidales bacterium]MBN2757087.1 preprotein translocase subunit YajC [Bacteroidales bacterium]
MSNLLYVLMMAPKEGENPLVSLLPLVLIIAVFYFFMIRPQMKKQKDLRKFRETIKNGDKILTIGGIYGKVVETSEKTVIIEVENKMRLKVDKTALAIDATDLMPKK